MVRMSPRESKFSFKFITDIDEKDSNFDHQETQTIPRFCTKSKRGENAKAKNVRHEQKLCPKDRIKS